MSKKNKPETSEGLERTRPTGRPAMRLRYVVLIAILVTSLIWGTALLAGKLTSSNDGTNSEGSTATPTAPVTAGASGKTAEQDKADVLAATAALINEAGKNPGEKMEPALRLQKLDDDDYTVISKKLPSMIRFAPSTPKHIQTTTYQALVTIHTVLVNTGGSETVKVKDQKAALGQVFMDSEVGMAFIPLSVFSGQESAFNFQMIYVDGKWVLSPYSLVEAISLSAAAGSQSSPTASPSASN